MVTHLALEMQSSRSQPGDEAEPSTHDAEGSGEIDQEHKPCNDRRRGKDDGKLGCRRTKLKEVIGRQFAVTLGFGLLGSLTELLSALAVCGSLS